SNKDKKEVK
ncbi:hypothetical protein FOXB_03218, partial [Fusarium oxysporum f. sp. conglutinans Fo5176]